MKKIIKYILISLSAITILICGCLIIIASFYEQEVINYLISELNKNIDTRINVERYNFSILKKFPDASVEFTNILAKSSPTYNKKNFSVNTDTLFYAKSLVLHFNIKNIWNGFYTIKKIDSKKGRLQIFIDEKGNGNYNFWKEDTSGTDSNIVLGIKDLMLDDFEFTYINCSENQKLNSYIKSLNLQGNFLTEKYSLFANADLLVKQFSVDEANYIDNQMVFVKTKMNVDNDLYCFEEGWLKIEGLEFDLAGSINNADDVTEVNIDIVEKSLNVKSFLSLLPAKYQKYTKDYKSSGDFFFTAKLSGRVTAPHIHADFGFNNGKIRKKSTGQVMRNVVMKGKFSGKFDKLETMSLNLSSFNAALGNNTSISGKYIMENFKHPKIQFDTKINIDLNELNSFIQLDTIEHMNGIVAGNVKFFGTFKDIHKITVWNFKNSKTQGSVVFKNVNLKLIRNPFEFQNISGDFSFKNNDIRIDSLHANISNSDFDIQGSVKNFMNYLFIKDQPISVNANISSSFLDIGNILDNDKDNNGEENNCKNATITLLPENIKLDINFDIKDLKYGKFTGNSINGNLKFSNDFSENYEETVNDSSINIIFPENISFSAFLTIDSLSFENFNANASQIKCKLDYNDKKLFAKDLYFKTMDGTILSTLEIYQKPDNNIIIKSNNSELRDINVQKLFYSFNNFGQDFITDKHLIGNLSADVNFSSEWTNDLICDKGKIFAESSIVISNGELINFEPMMGVSKFVKVEELNHIKFSKLKNNITIKDKTIIIPQMEINSSAFDIILSGTHTFENQIDYHFKILLSDILSRKAKEVKKENEEFGVIEDDGLGRTSLFLSISGSVDDYKIAYDRKKAKEAIVKNFKEEKNELKTTLHEEFGCLKKDTSIISQKNNNKAHEQKFIIEWDEDAPEEIDFSDTND